MENGIRIGNELSKESADNIRQLVETTFRVGAETRMEQSTIQVALHMIERVAKVENVTITNSVVKGDNHVHMDGEAPIID